MLEQCVFANDSFVKNNELETPAHCELRRKFNIDWNDSVPVIRDTISRWVDNP